MKNPFKFGTVVDDDYFTNRTKEIESVKSILTSKNHLILFSPRRYGKTSLILNVTKSIKRPVIYLDLQLISTVSDFAAELLKRIHKHFHISKLKSLISNFRIIPTLSINPLNGELSVNFQPAKSEIPIIEDVLELLENISKTKNSILVLDEFQEILKIDSKLDRILRSIMQHHQNVNYVFLGSEESMMMEIFEKKKSPFYHFGYLMKLNKIPEIEFLNYLTSRFINITQDTSNDLPQEILKLTNCHPYYTQQLASKVWDLIILQNPVSQLVELAINEIVAVHDYDYERIWNNFNQTDKNILVYYTTNSETPYNQEASQMLKMATSTIYSAVKRLLKSGYLVRSENIFEIDDPFFRIWIQKRRNFTL